MKNAELEVWVRSIVDRAMAGLPSEDSRVELKSEWPDNLPRAARQIAGLCNAARGTHVLWIIGVDEKARRVVPLPTYDRAAWWHGIHSQFDELSPEFHDLVVPTAHGEVVGLLFGAERAPYVVRNPAYGKADLQDAVEREVPWREGTRTRSARRGELLDLLVPILNLPDVELIDAVVRSGQEGTNFVGQYTGYRYCDIEVTIFVTPRSDQPITVPFHTCRLGMVVPGVTPHFLAPTVTLNRYSAPGVPVRSDEISSTPTEVRIRSPGTLVARSRFASKWYDVPTDSPLEVELDLRPALATYPVGVRASLPRRSADPQHGDVWQYSEPSKERRLPGGEYLPPVIDNRDEHP